MRPTSTEGKSRPDQLGAGRARLYSAVGKVRQYLTVGGHTGEAGK